MNSRRTFLVSLPLVTVGVVSANAQKNLDCADSAKTVEEIKKALLLPADWAEGKFDGRKFLFALMELPTDGESYIDLHGWVYNQYYQEWRRFLNIKTRKLGGAKIHLDKGLVSIRGTANNEFNGIDVLRFDLRATSNDVAYKR